MYIHHLGIQNEERLNRYGRAGTVSPQGGNVEKTDFGAQLRRAVMRQTDAQQKNEDVRSAADGESTCCEQCKRNSQLLTCMMTQSLYLDGGLGGLAGLSALGSSARAALAYRNMSHIYNGIFGSV